MTMSDRIIIQQLHGHWTAWWQSQPETAFGGTTPAEAVDLLVGYWEPMVKPLRRACRRMFPGSDSTEITVSLDE